MGAKQQPGRGPILFLTRALLVFLYSFTSSFHFQHRFFSFSFSSLFFLLFICNKSFPLRESSKRAPGWATTGRGVRGKCDPAQLLHSPPPGGHHDDDLCSLPLLFIYILSFVFAFRSICIQQNIYKNKNKNLKNSGTGTDKWVLASASSSCSHPP